jgi:hypothetical protein
MLAMKCETSCLISARAFSTGRSLEKATIVNDKNMATKAKVNKKEAAIMGASIAALAVGAYFLTGTKGRQNRKKLRGWMVRMKGDVIERLEDVREVTEPIYRDIVDTVAQAEIVASRIPRRDILVLAEELKQDWKSITRLAKGKKPKAATRRTAPKTTARRGGKKATSKK